MIFLLAYLAVTAQASFMGGGGSGGSSFGSGYGSGTEPSYGFFEYQGGFSVTDGGTSSGCGADGKIITEEPIDDGSVNTDDTAAEERNCIDQIQSGSFDCKKQANKRLVDDCNALKGQEGTTIQERMDADAARNKVCDVSRAIADQENTYDGARRMEAEDRNRRRLAELMKDLPDYSWNPKLYPDLQNPESKLYKHIAARRRRRLEEEGGGYYYDYASTEGGDYDAAYDFGGADTEDFDADADCDRDEDNGKTGYGENARGAEYGKLLYDFPKTVGASLCTVGNDNGRRMDWTLGDITPVDVIVESEAEREERSHSTRRRAESECGSLGDIAGEEDYPGDNEDTAVDGDYRRRAWGASVSVQSASCGNYVIAGQADSGCGGACLKVVGSFGLSGGCPYYNWAVRYRRRTHSWCWRCGWSSCPGWYRCHYRWVETELVSGGRNLCCASVDITPVWSPIDVSIEACFFSQAQCGSAGNGACGRGYKLTLTVEALFGLASVSANLACSPNHVFLNCCGRRRMPFMSDADLLKLGMINYQLKDVNGEVDMLNY